MRKFIFLAVIAAAVLGISSARAEGPNPSANGHSADENHVSSTSSS